MRLLLALMMFTIGFTSYGNEKGAQLYQACIQCHGENGQGDQTQEAPKIAGQHDWYIYSSLVAFKSKERSNPKMYPFIENLSDQDFKDLSDHISKMK